MCEAYFRDFTETYDELKDKFIRNPQRELLVKISQDVYVKLKFDAKRVKDIIGYKPLRYNGHDSLPVLVNNKIRLDLAYDLGKERWFLPCGKKHFPWCKSYRGRIA
ncbi:MAG: hypothetical protein NVSMB39_0940 [Candidatus Saccharimonadales bacterium]